jgi:hypothetical protein
MLLRRGLIYRLDADGDVGRQVLAQVARSRRAP